MIQVTKEAIALGAKVKDRLTGGEGIVIARTEWLFRSPTVLCEMPDGRREDMHEGRMKVIGVGEERT